MATRIYVGNIPWAATTDELYTLFARRGAVLRAQIIIERENGRSRGFGFVDMENQEEANAAIAALNESEWNGRTLIVNPA